jgi:L-asparaginase II
MSKFAHLPLYELTRGEFVESIHFGSIAISDIHGHLVAWYGDADTVTYLRSSAKPFQALPLIEEDGQSTFGLSLREIAVICASHSGTDEHVATVRAIQRKTGVCEIELLCGVHPVYDKKTAENMRERGEEPTPNRNNCSGKHTGMLTCAHMMGWSTHDYLDPEHPLQQRILESFAEMSAVHGDEIVVGIDGCSAPNFAVPLRNAALAYAQLCDPSQLPDKRAKACRTITTAMTQNPTMVAGNGKFDTRLIEIAGSRIISKGGGEGYQAIGLLPDALGPGSQALGIAFKISDGDLLGRARPAVALEILDQLGALTQMELGELSEFGPSLPVNNWQKIVVGHTQPTFRLHHASQS